MTAHFQCFVTGTDTEVGKTLVSSALLHALKHAGVRAAGMKPIAAGAEIRAGVMHNDDVERLAAASGVDVPRDIAAPYLLCEPVAPHWAAALQGVHIDGAHILECHARIAELADAVVVEGVGGFRVPLSERLDTAELAQQLGLPIVMVVGLRLGCLNHTLLTAEAIARRGLNFAGWVANLVDPQMRHVEANLEALRLRLDAPLLGYLPHLRSASAAVAAQYLDFSLLPNWPARTNDA